MDLILLYLYRYQLRNISSYEDFMFHCDSNVAVLFLIV